MKNQIFILVLILCNMNVSGQVKSKILYVGDPMCSWCYGIAEELDKVKHLFEGKVDFELIVGGLRPGGGDEWNNDFKSFLDHHWQEVHLRSGAKFNHDILQSDHFDYDTEPACRAVVVARSMKPSITLDFFRAVQYKFYFENKDPKSVSFYKSLCDSFGLDYSTFSAKFQSEEYRILTAQDFSKARQMGANSFPTIILLHNNQFITIAKGYKDAKSIIESIEKRIN